MSVIFGIVGDGMVNFVGYYRKNGKSTSEMRSIRLALEALSRTTTSLLRTFTWLGPPDVLFAAVDLDGLPSSR